MLFIHMHYMELFCLEKLEVHVCGFRGLDLVCSAVTFGCSLQGLQGALCRAGRPAWERSGHWGTATPCQPTSASLNPTTSL